MPAIHRLVLAARASARVDRLLEFDPPWRSREGIDWSGEEPPGRRLVALLNEQIGQLRASLRHDAVIAALGNAGCIVERRVAAIVEAKNRGAYRRAALVACAHADALAAATSGHDADGFLDAVRARYPRHSAFKYELDQERRRE